MTYAVQRTGYRNSRVQSNTLDYIPTALWIPTKESITECKCVLRNSQGQGDSGALYIACVARTFGRPHKNGIPGATEHAQHQQIASQEGCGNVYLC